MKPHIIQCLLKERGISQTDLAKVIGVGSAALSGVISGLDRSEKIERAISKTLKLPVQSLFPQRYDAEGNARRARRQLNQQYDPSKSFAALAEAVAKIQPDGVAA